MKNSARKLIVAANWKMNKTASEAEAFIEDLALAVGRQLEVSVLVCPPFTALERSANKLEGSNLLLGAQNMYPERSGAFTGEISPEMLRQLFVTHVIIGHSERRSLFGESDAFIHRKLTVALESKLRPILCVGESLEERQSHQTKEVIKHQLKTALQGLSEKVADALIIAYEPLWAIGTGQTASPSLAQEVHAFIREELAILLGENAAQRIRILYGGSMKPDNAAALMAQADIDGGLIGGASLEVRNFIKIVEIAQELTH